MRFFQKTIRGSLVRERENGQLVAMFIGIIINTENGSVVAYEVFTRKRKMAYVVPGDVLSWGKDNLTITEEGAVMEVEDLPRVKAEIKKGGRLVDMKVETTSGDDLGKVVDVQFDTDADMLLKIYTKKKRFWVFTVDERLITFDQIVKIKPNKIIISENIAKKKVLAPANMEDMQEKAVA